MTISTYSELKTAVANWLNRTDLTSRDAEFIAMFEAKFAREARTLSMMQRATTSLSGEYTELPTGFLQMVSLKLTGSTIYSLQPVTTEWINENYRDGSTGIPRFFAVLSCTEVRVAPPPDSTYTAEMIYHKFTALSDNATTNWLLISHPDLYLFGSLCEAEPYLGNDERFPMWKSRRDEEMASVIRAEKRAQWGGGVMRVRADAIA